MSIRNPIFDNPADVSKFPKRPPPFEFPATTYYPSREAIQSIFSLYLGGLIGLMIVVACMRMTWNPNNPAFHMMQIIAQLGIVLFLVILAILPTLMVRGFSTIMTLACIVETILILGSPSLTINYLTILPGILFVWASLDLATHWITINPMEGKPTMDDPRYVIVAVLSLIVILTQRFFVFSYHSLFVTLILSAILIGLAILINQDSGYKFVPLLIYGLTNYVFYPDAKSTAPGLITTTSSASFLRPLPFAIFIVAFSACWGFSIHDPQPLNFVAGLVAAITLAAGQLCFVLIATAMPAKIDSDQTQWNEAVNANSSSKVPLHRNSIFLGKVAIDGSPVQIDRSLICQHVHFLGRTGSGKTSMGLVPMTEQLIIPADASVIAIDLKGDSLELLAAMESARQQTKKRLGKEMPLRVFSMKNDVHTFGFNPFLTKGWKKLSILERTDIVCSALGIDYGSEYGKAFFSACNAALIIAANQENPDAMSFRQLLQEVERILRSKESDQLLPEIKKNAAHAWFTLKRMSALDAINVTAPTLASPDVLDHQIELSDFFVRPQLAYFQLPSTIAASAAPAIGRLVAQFLLLAGNHCPRTNKVYLVIDEFQRMASDSLNQLFQMSRSLDIGLILANQSMSDLKAINKSLASSVEANCHVRQWFSVGDQAELEMLEKMFGTREELKYSHTASTNGSSVTTRWEDVPRASSTDLQSISDDPQLSILSITGDRKGYGQYRGVPFVVRSEFHITSEEYDRRKKFAWPSDLPGMMVGSTTFPKADKGRDPAERDFSDDRNPEPPSWQSEIFE